MPLASSQTGGRKAKTTTQTTPRKPTVSPESRPHKVLNGSNRRDVQEEGGTRVTSLPGVSESFLEEVGGARPSRQVKSRGAGGRRHTAPEARQLHRSRQPSGSREGRSQTGSSRAPLPTVGSALHCWAWRGAAAGKAVMQGCGPWPAEVDSGTRNTPGGASWWGCSGRAHLRGHPGLAAPACPGRQPSGWRCRGPRSWSPSSQTRSWSEPASWPLPSAAPDLA